MEIAILSVSQIILLVVVFLLSFPLHELGHVIAIKILSANQCKLDINWFSFEPDFSKLSGGELRGSVYIKKMTLSDFWLNHPELSYFFIGFSGGCGTVIFLSPLVLILFFIPSSTPSLLTPVLIVMGLDFLYAIKEGFGVTSSEMLSISDYNG
ncbi:hypothetical protein CL630_01320 [bacterium]|nr:hypothetical protein [bacterium]|tara:strand:- start:340 stop:798 length:459 start_codon:yes stop_codon:yes gene_type:complete